VMEQDEQNGVDSKQLANRLVKIVEMKQPGLVYREGMTIQTTLVSLLSWLPNRLVEKLLMGVYKI